MRDKGWAKRGNGGGGAGRGRTEGERKGATEEKDRRQ